MHPGLSCQHYPCHHSHACTAPFPEDSPGEFLGSYWQKSPMQTVLSTDLRYKTQFLVMYTHSQPPHWFMSRLLQDYGSNPSGTVMDTVILGPSPSFSWSLHRMCLFPRDGFTKEAEFSDLIFFFFLIIGIGQEELMSSDLSQKQLWSVHQYLGPGIETRSSKHYTCCSAMQSQDDFSPICKGVSHPSEG